MKNKNILVSGASIAGPALAYWLRRHGFNPTVVERAPALRAGGYKIDLRGAAIDVAERMGVLADVRRAATDMQGASFVDENNKRLVTVAADTFGMRTERDVEVMRGELSRILYDASAGDAEYLFGDSIASLAQDDDGVRVAFESGAERTFDLVLGADGLHSNVRALAFGDEARFRVDSDCYVSIFTTQNHQALDRWELIYPRPGKIVNVYSTRQSTEARALFIFTSPPLSYDRRDVAQQKKILTDVYAGTGWEVPRLLDAMHDAPDFYFDSISQIRMDGWSRGRVALVGDAAYCPSLASGQGSSLALVGAYVLAGELKAAGGDHRAAFAGYEAKMRDFVTQNQDFGRDAIKEMVPRSRAQLWFQTQALRTLSFSFFTNLVLGPMRRKVERLSNAVALEDYQG